MARGGFADCATKQGFLGPILPTNAPLSLWALLVGLSTRIGRQLAEAGVDQEFSISIGDTGQALIEQMLFRIGPDKRPVVTWPNSRLVEQMP